jgi:hypothetical protein
MTNIDAIVNAQELTHKIKRLNQKSLSGFDPIAWKFNRFPFLVNNSQIGIARNPTSLQNKTAVPFSHNQQHFVKEP